MVVNDVLSPRFAMMDMGSFVTGRGPISASALAPRAASPSFHIAWSVRRATGQTSEARDAGKMNAPWLIQVIWPVPSPPM